MTKFPDVQSLVGLFPQVDLVAALTYLADEGRTNGLFTPHMLM